jgi:hypothetical protein
MDTVMGTGMDTDTEPHKTIPLSSCIQNSESSNEYYINKLKSNFKYLTTISKETIENCSGVVWI